MVEDSLFTQIPTAGLEADPKIGLRADPILSYHNMGWDQESRTADEVGEHAGMPLLRRPESGLTGPDEPEDS